MRHCRPPVSPVHSSPDISEVHTYTQINTTGSHTMSTLAKAHDVPLALLQLNSSISLNRIHIIHAYLCVCVHTHAHALLYHRSHILSFKSQTAQLLIPTAYCYMVIIIMITLLLYTQQGTYGRILLVPFHQTGFL